MTNVTEKTARAVKYQGVLTLLGKFANLIQVVILAHLLFPKDYGFLTIALILTNLANLLSNFGVQTYVIQARELSLQTARTCYTLNVMFSIGLGATLAVAGWLWPGISSTLRWMLALYGVCVALQSAVLVHVAMFKRELDFDDSSRCDLLFMVSSAVARVLFALAGTGALSFAFGDVLGAMLSMLYVARVAKGHDLKLVRLDHDSMKGPLRFGMHTMSLSLASFISNNVDKTLVSSSNPIQQVGFYNFAQLQSAQFYNAVILPQTGVFQATFSRLHSDPAAIRGMLKTSSNLVMTLCLPVQLLICVESRNIIHVVFSDKWLPSATLLSILSVGFIIRAAGNAIIGLQVSLGRIEEAARMRWLNAIVFVVCIGTAYLLHAGVVGYGYAFVISGFVTMIHNSIVNGRLIDLPLSQHLRHFARPLAAGALAMLGYQLATHLVPIALAPLAALLFGSAVFLVAYLVGLILFNREMLRMVLKQMTGRPRG